MLVLTQSQRMTYPNTMTNVIPIKEFVKNITDKGCRVEIIEHGKLITEKYYTVIIYKEVEIKE